MCVRRGTLDGQRSRGAFSYYKAKTVSWHFIGQSIRSRGIYSKPIIFFLAMNVCGYCREKVLCYKRLSGGR